MGPEPSLALEFALKLGVVELVERDNAPRICNSLANLRAGHHCLGGTSLAIEAFQQIVAGSGDQHLNWKISGVSSCGHIVFLGYRDLPHGS